MKINIDVIREQLAAGKTIAQIAAETGELRTSIWRAAKREGLIESKQQKRLDLTPEEALRLQNEGASLSEIAKLKGTTVEHVSTWFKRNGLKSSLPPTPRKDHVTVEKILELKKEIGNVKISRELGCASSLVYARLNEAGLIDKVDGSISDRTKAALASPEVRHRIANALAGAPRTLSRGHVKINDILDELGVEYINEKVFGPWAYDIYIPSHKILIEAQGDWFHGPDKPQRQSRDKAKATYIERYVPDHKLYHLWETELYTEGLVYNRLKYWLGIKDDVQPVDFGKLIVHEPPNDDVNKFLFNWHYIGAGRSAKLNVGIQYDGKLIAVAKFAHPSRLEISVKQKLGHNEVLELSRLCIHPRYQVKNLGSWFLARCERIITARYPNIKLLIAFSDTGQGHTGIVYRASNWTYDGEVAADYRYKTPDGHMMHKRSMWSRSNKARMPEGEFAASKGYVRVNGFKKLRFIKAI